MHTHLGGPMPVESRCMLRSSACGDLWYRGTVAYLFRAYSCIVPLLWN